MFWVFHAMGFLGVLYRPIQYLFATTATGWPSLVSALLLYLAAASVFELLCRPRQDNQP